VIERSSFGETLVRADRIVQPPSLLPQLFYLADITLS
jgi:hypothetical protein